MVKILYKKTISFWSRIFMFAVSLFSFSNTAKSYISYRSCLSRDISNLQSAYSKLNARSENLKRKLEVIKKSSSESTLTYDNLLAEIAELEVARNTLLSSINDLRNRISAGDSRGIYKSDARTSSSYNFCG